MDLPNLIEERVEAARKGRNPYVICRMPSGWLVIGDVQPLPGYCVLLADPVVESPNALDEVQRSRYSLDTLRVGDAWRASRKFDPVADRPFVERMRRWLVG